MLRVVVAKDDRVIGPRGNSIHGVAHAAPSHPRDRTEWVGGAFPSNALRADGELVFEHQADFGPERDVLAPLSAMVLTRRRFGAKLRDGFRMLLGCLGVFPRSRLGAKLGDHFRVLVQLFDKLRKLG